MTPMLIRAAGVVSAPQGTETAILVRDGRIAAMGSWSELARPGIDVIDHGDSHLSPVIHDHHFHPIGYAAAVTRLSLKDVDDFDELGDRLRAASIAGPPGEPLVGNRLDDETLAERRLPTRDELDAMVPERPILLYRYCGHVAVVNTAALRLAGLPEEASGILREADIQPVAKVVAAAQAPLRSVVVHRVLAGLTSLGIGRLTAIVSSGAPIWCDVPDEIGTLLAVAPGLPIDFEILVIAGDPSELKEAADRLARSARNVSFGGWKDFADGSLGGRTAALYEPYDDDPTTNGALRLDRDHFRIMSDACLELGGQVAIHAIGDRANDLVLDLFEELVDDGARPASLRIEHASVLTDKAIQRMARLGITASVQPSFLSSEAAWLGKRLGERTALTYPLATLDAAGIRLLGGSDCPVESPNPWWGMASARDQGGLSPAAAFRLYASPFRVGEAADLLVLPFDPVKADSARLRDMKPSAVYRHGDLVELVDEMPFI